MAEIKPSSRKNVYESPLGACHIRIAFMGATVSPPPSRVTSPENERRWPNYILNGCRVFHLTIDLCDSKRTITAEMNEFELRCLAKDIEQFIYELNR